MFDYSFDTGGLPRKHRDFAFFGGALPLHLVETVFEWEGVRIDRLVDADAWSSWLDAAHLPPVGDPASATELRNVRRLREAVYLLARAHTRRSRPPAQAIAVVNEFAAVPAVPQILHGAGLTLSERPQRPPTHIDVLSRIARETVDLLGGVHADRVRECSDHHCPTIFFDNSAAGLKMWCSPRCATRAATRAYRERRRQAMAELARS